MIRCSTSSNTTQHKRDCQTRSSYTTNCFPVACTATCRHIVLIKTSTSAGVAFMGSQGPITVHTGKEGTPGSNHQHQNRKASGPFGGSILIIVHSWCCASWLGLKSAFTSISSSLVEYLEEESSSCLEAEIDACDPV